MNYCRRVECSNYSLFLHTVFFFSCRGITADGILASWDDERLLPEVLDLFHREIPSRRYLNGMPARSAHLIAKCFTFSPFDWTQSPGWKYTVEALVDDNASPRAVNAWGISHRASPALFSRTDNSCCKLNHSILSTLEHEPRLKGESLNRQEMRVMQLFGAACGTGVLI
jgi:hypothetical protein